MNWPLCWKMAFCSWTSGAFNSLIHTIYTMKFPFRGSREIHHFYSELPSLASLLLGHLYLWGGVFISTTVLLLIPFLVLLASYTVVLVTIIKMPSIESQKKAFSICTSHLTMVSLHYSAIIFMYMRSISSHTFNQDKVVTVLYTILTPMLNTVIYSLRNKDVIGGLEKNPMALCIVS